MANPFDDDAADSFGAVSKGGGGLSYGEDGEDEDDINVYERQIMSAMQGTLESTQRSRGMLEESEDAGKRTAEQLIHQREQLEKADRNLDEINATTTQTQRHLNNIKSVFGGLKNKFGRKASAPATAPDAGGKSSTKLEATLGKMEADTSGFYASSGPGERSLPESSRRNLSQALQEMDAEVDENLDAMSSQLRGLQSLGRALGDEIEEQNELLDRITSKADKTDAKVRDQDKQMKKILGFDKKTPKDSPAPK